MTEPLLEIWTDGACKNNPGPGGWGVLMRYGTRTKEMSGGANPTTNNQMELTAVIEAFKAIRRPCPVRLHLDSSYVKNGITQWIHSWKKNGWRTSSKAPVKNVEYWVTLDKLNDELNVDWQWVKGHAGIAGNEECDRLVRMETAKFL